MAEEDINMERFAHDVCVSVLEKFGVFKPPDDMRKQNKYLGFDFLPCISRTVVVYTILIRDCLKNELEDSYKKEEFNIEIILQNFHDYLQEDEAFKALDSIGKMCVSLALCTDYIQFMSTKHILISLNKIVTSWNNFFEKNLRKDFEAEGGFKNTYSFFKSFLVDGLDDLLEEFISEYLLPYGARECTVEFVRRCAELPGIPLVIALFGVKKINLLNEEGLTEMPEEQCETGDLRRSPSDAAEIKVPKQEINNSEDYSSTSTSVEGDSEKLQSAESETSNSEILQNELLGIPPHEEMLRGIDPFFVENIPSPPKPQENEPVAREDLPLSPDQEELTAMVDEILSKLEHDMEALRNLLFEHGLLSMKSGRRGSVRCKDGKGKKPPKGPEGLI